MEKNLPPKLNSEILRQLAIEQLVEIIIEQGTTIEALKSRVVDRIIYIKKSKIYEDFSR